MGRAVRSETDYVIESLLHGLQVLEALEGTQFEPVSIKRIAERAKLSYDKASRCMKTLKVKGFVEQTERGWALAPRFIAFCQRASAVQIGS